MKYDSLYGGRPPFVAGSDTSEEAADSMIPVALTIRGKVLGYITRKGSRGATCWEIEVGMSLAHQTASARIRELQQKGQVKDSGWRRRTGSNRNAVVWVVADLPESQMGPAVSLRNQLEAAQRRIQELESENAQLRRQLSGISLEWDLFKRIAR